MSDAKQAATVKSEAVYKHGRSLAESTSLADFASNRSNMLGNQTVKVTEKKSKKMKLSKGKGRKQIYLNLVKERYQLNAINEDEATERGDMVSPRSPEAASAAANNREMTPLFSDAPAAEQGMKMTMTSIPLHEDAKSLLDQKSPPQFDTATKQGDQKDKKVPNADKDRKVTEGSDPDPRINLQMIDDSSADSFLADDSEDKQDQNEKLDDA